MDLGTYIYVKSVFIIKSENTLNKVSVLVGLENASVWQDNIEAIDIKVCKSKFESSSVTHKCVPGTILVREQREKKTSVLLIGYNY